jgi:hypothetical protein
MKGGLRDQLELLPAHQSPPAPGRQVTNADVSEVFSDR